MHAHVDVDDGDALQPVELAEVGLRAPGLRQQQLQRVHCSHNTSTCSSAAVQQAFEGVPSTAAKHVDPHALVRTELLRLHRHELSTTKTALLSIAIHAGWVSIHLPMQQPQTLHSAAATRQGAVQGVGIPGMAETYRSPRTVVPSVSRNPSTRPSSSSWMLCSRELSRISPPLLLK